MERARRSSSSLTTWARRSLSPTGVVVMTARPGTVKRICPVPLERPRDLFHLHDDERFRQTYDTLWDDLEAEVRRAPA